MKHRHLALTIGLGAVLLGGSVLPLRAAASGPDRYVSPFGVDTGDCSDPLNPCQTITYAVGQANQSGDTIHLARGAYQEQVLITKSLTLQGAGRDHSTILAPTALVTDARPEPQTYIVAITNDGTNPAPAVTITGLTVAGPGPQGGGTNCASNPSSLDKGIEVYGGASLSMSAAAVRNIYDRPTSGCQRGDAISIGTACYSCTADTGSAVLKSVVVSAYQKNGIAVRGAGSSLKASSTQVLDNPNPVIGSNGVEVLNGALAQLGKLTISGNECNLASACGPDPASQVLVNDGSGLLVYGGAAPHSFLNNSTVTGNDMGIYTDSGFHFGSDTVDNNRYIGVVADVDTASANFTSVTASSTGATPAEFGFYVLSPSFNVFSTDTATGNTNTEGSTQTPYDMYAKVSGHDNNIYTANTCATGYPSVHYWNCA